LSITIRAVGQAGRRGPARRVPNAQALLDLVDAWLSEHAGDPLRGHVAGARQPDGSLVASLHPAARPIRFEATDSGKMIATAQTVPVGPGYHTYVSSLLHRLGDDLDVTWAGAAADGPARDSEGPIGDRTSEARGRGGRIGGAVLSRATALPSAVLSRSTAAEDVDEPSTDPTGTFFSGRRADAERSHLAWLRASLHAVADARRRGAAGLHLATPPGVRYRFDGAVATVLGPRDDAWVERALGDPRTASDVWPWVADAIDARYHLNRALTLMWTEIRWRPSVAVAELGVLDEALASLRHAYPLEPSLPWPWREWREAFLLRGSSDPGTAQLLEREAAARGSGAGDDDRGDEVIGYRRRPVTILHEGWALDLPGSFTDERTDEEWTGSDAGRTVTLAATPTAIGDVPMPAEAFLRQFAAGLGRDAIEHEVGPVRGRARLSSDAPTGVEVATVEGYSAVRGSGAAIRIVIEDPGDWKWALDTWRNLRPA
jgi:hypothetical protein